MASLVTLNDRLEATGGRPTGFDYLRIILASSVVFSHSMDLTFGYNVAFTDFHGAFRPVYDLILPMFFALSGFLVAGSLERSRTLISFLGLRAIRLLPALAVETVLCAIFLGLLFTSLPYARYFTSSGFAHYFLNIIGDIHFTLPGVFKENPVTFVNFQLWTVPWEMKCYALISLLAILTLAKRKEFLFAVTLLFNALIFAHHLWSSHPDAGVSMVVPGIILVESFLYGICLFSFRAKVIWNGWIAFGCLACFMVFASPPFAKWGYQLLAFPGAYMTVYVGLLEPKKAPFIFSGDYSYGIYLYGYPVQQSVIAAFGHPAMPWVLNFIISYPIAVLLSVGSWHLVEKHAGKLRNALFRAEKRICDGVAKIWRRKRPVAAE